MATQSSYVDANGKVYYDLTTRTGDSAAIDGAFFLTDAAEGSSGTGLIQAFVRVQNTGNEDGYNTSERPLAYDENSSPTFTKSLLLNQVPIVERDGVQYYEFRLDINQLNSAPLLSLDALKVYTSTSADYSGTITSPTFTGTTDLVWDLDDQDLDGPDGTDVNNSVLLDYSLESGSGVSDMFFYVPVSDFGGADPNTTYVVVYSEFGTTGVLSAEDGLVARDDPGTNDSADDATAIYGVYVSNDGFEEWSVSKELGGFISGYKWGDTNGNGVWDAGETGLAGWDISYSYTVKVQGQDIVYTGGLTTSDGTTDYDNDGELDAIGYYVIPIDAGNVNYSITVTEVIKDGWANTFDGDATLNGETVVSISKNTDPEDYPHGDLGVTEDLNFGNFELYSISGTKFEDETGDGATTGDSGLAGWTVFIDENGNGEFDVGEKSDVTDSDGNWSITGLDASYNDLTVYEVNQEGWVQTLGELGHVIEGTSGNDQTDFDFANFDLFDISGTKYEDIDGDGTVDEGEDGLEGWTVFIDMDASGDLSDGDLETTTDEDGNWSFTGLGTEVDGKTVYEQNQTGWLQTLGAAGYLLEGTSGNDQEDLDFANFENMNLSGYKWADVDGSGTWNEDGTAVLEGWTVVLDNNDNFADGVIATVVTDSNGYWEFTDLNADSYGGKVGDDADGILHVYEVQQDGFTQTYGGFTFSVESGYLVEGTVGVTEDGNFGNQMMGGANRTPGFWQSKLGSSLYDGNNNNNGDANGDGKPDGDKDFAEEGWSTTDLLTKYGVDKTAPAGNDTFILRDVDGDSNYDAGDLFLTAAQLKFWVSGGPKGGNDFLSILERDVAAAFLNTLNNHSLTTPDVTDSDPFAALGAMDPTIEDSFDEAIDFILQYDPNFDGVATGNKKAQQSDWNGGGSAAHTELAAFNESGESLFGLTLKQVVMDGDDYSSLLVQNYLAVQNNLVA